MVNVIQPDAFDPRPLRIAAAICVFFLVIPGTGEGAALLWSMSGGAVPVSLASPSTHAMTQLGGGFMTLIQAFLALSVPHLLGLDMKKARRILVPIAVIAVGLLGNLAAEHLGAHGPLLAARAIGVVGAVGSALVFVAARTLKNRPLLEVPLPFLALSIALYPVVWLLFLGEALAWVPSGTAADAGLFLVVVPVVMSMGWKMFSAMLQIETGHGPRLVAAVVAWLVGGIFVVAARFEPRATVAAPPFLLAGALLWLASMHALRRRRGGLTLQATAGPELRVHVVVAVVCWLVAPTVWLGATLAGLPVLIDVARHIIAIGVVLNITMGVTLRALPRFCRGRQSSALLDMTTLAVLVTGLLLRFGRVLDDGGLTTRLSSLLTLLAVVLWGAHLLRGLPEVKAEPVA